MIRPSSESQYIAIGRVRSETLQSSDPREKPRPSLQTPRRLPPAYKIVEIALLRHLVERYRGVGSFFRMLVAKVRKPVLRFFPGGPLTRRQQKCPSYPSRLRYDVSTREGEASLKFTNESVEESMKCVCTATTLLSGMDGCCLGKRAQVLNKNTFRVLNRGRPRHRETLSSHQSKREFRIFSLFSGFLSTSRHSVISTSLL